MSLADDGGSRIMRLESLNFHEPLMSLELSTLSSLGPLFTLPKLDENAAGTDRLLSKAQAVRVTQAKGSKDESIPVEQSKGKERADELEPTTSRLRSTAWTDLLNTTSNRVFQPLQTWDEFAAPSSSKNPVLSRTAPRLFESLITLDAKETRLPHLQARDAAEDICQSSELLPLLMQSTLGLNTASQLVWDEQTARFQLAPNLIIADLSHPALQFLASSFLDVGTSIRRLEIVIDRHATTPMTATHHAFLHALSTYLSHLKRALSATVNSVPRWRNIELDSISRVTHLLCDLVGWSLGSRRPTSLPSRASYLLNGIYSRLLAHISTSSTITEETLALAYLLQECSTPVLSLLHSWLGLSSSDALHEDEDPISQPWTDIGITRKRLSGGRWEYDLKLRHMPGFISEETAEEIFNAGKSLRLLREASPDHPLSHASYSLPVKWKWAESSSSHPSIRDRQRELADDVEHWRQSKRQGFSARQKERKPMPRFLSPSSPVAIGPTAENELLEDLSGPPGSHLPHGTLWAPAPMDTLEAFLRRFNGQSLLPFDTPTLPIYVQSVILTPLLTHAKLLSASLVSVYLEDLSLLDHLDVLWAFFLGGDIGFTDRANAALFGKDHAGAGEALGLGRRARTRARMGLTPARKGQAEPLIEEADWGIGLGLGLSERNQWPPGGAELAYALRTTLFEETRRKESPVWQSIEDRVSFTLKDLPEEKDGERAKWMNPQAIEALDFLYLSYSPDRSIRHLLPTSLMAKYQRIHNFLLRLARVETVLRSMYHDVTHQISSALSSKRGVDLVERPRASTPGTTRDRKLVFPTLPRKEHLVNCLRFRMTAFVTNLARYILDVAIGKNWQAMRRTLERIKKGSVDLDASETEEEPISPTLQSIHSLETYHHLVSDRILRSTFLLIQSPSSQKAYGILMQLFGLVLDLGKLLKMVQLGADEDRGAADVDKIFDVWNMTEAAFMHTLERLAWRNNHTSLSQNEEHGDLALLTEHESSDIGPNDLADLLIRLRLDAPSARRGKWAAMTEEL
ncbi:Spc98 family-domain-containing protein [Kockovaella imperatae]|uniref:Spindle pole body component n=1 Tax=Kockovaella imperatae TaxID=4999 RepID=A0A1Y1UFI0_9TREE|nr:Spc98 family-domain-containing protein [Kockovaella imperatae]ORX36749.1 Spc98 family-domain-containing protein [Kockovaella imperatae]